MNIIPVGIDFTSGGELTLGVDVPFRNYKFWLEDRVTGIFTDLSSDSYRITLPAETYGTGRFCAWALLAGVYGSDQTRITSLT